MTNFNGAVQGKARPARTHEVAEVQFRDGTIRCTCGWEATVGRDSARVEAAWRDHRKDAAA